jgi:hypothetical protein
MKHRLIRPSARRLHEPATDVQNGAPPGTRSSLTAAALMVLVGCAKIETTQETSYREISSNTQHLDYGPWQREVSVTSSGPELLFQGSKTRYCDVVTTRLGESVTKTRRENNDTLAGTWLLGIIGVAGASALAWGLDQHFNKDKPLEKPGDEGLSKQGYAVVLGSIGSIGLVTATDAAIRSLDSSKSVPETKTSEQRELCERRPLAASRLQVVANDQVLAEGKTGSDGTLKLDCLSERLELLGSPAEVRIDGGVPLAQPLRERYGFPRLPTAASPAQASSSQAGPPAFTYGEPSARQQLRLFRHDLAQAQRTQLLEAALRAGARKLEENAHVTSLDVATLVWPHALRLKMLFNGHGVFVKAHWEGDYTGPRQTELLRALCELYGQPVRITRSDGTLLLRWSFADGLEIHYARLASKDPSACPLAELSYVDPVLYAAFETAVNTPRQ